MIITTVLDYIMVFTYIIFTFYIWGNQFDIWGGLWGGVTMFMLMTFHDQLYCWILPENISQAKLDYRVTKENLFSMAKLYVLFTVMAMHGAYTNLYHLDWKGLNTLYIISFEYWFISQVKDSLVMKNVHKWMHEYSWFYTLHKHHHVANANIQITNAFHFDIIDTFIENLGAPVLLCVLYFSLGLPVRVHFASFLFLQWTDGMVHSLNPYTVIYFNPIVDYFLKANINHNLHHIIQKGYYVFNPWNHLFDRESLAKDIKIYNEVCKTNISYDLFI
jgi:hypothetical protein